MCPKIGKIVRFFSRPFCFFTEICPCDGPSRLKSGGIAPFDVGVATAIFYLKRHHLCAFGHTSRNEKDSRKLNLPVSRKLALSVLAIVSS